MATFDTLGFIEAAKKQGWQDQEIHNYLERNGYDPALPSQEVSTGVGGFLKGAAKGLGSTVVGTGRLLNTIGTGMQAAIDPTKTYGDYKEQQIQGNSIMRSESELGTKVDRALTARGGAEKWGKGIETAAEFVVPLTKAKLLSKLPGAKSLTKIPGSISEVTLGTKGSRAIEEAFTNPATQAKVLSGEITPTTIAAKIKESAASFKTESIKALEFAKEGLENFNVGKKKVLSDVNAAMRKTLGVDDGIKIDLSKLPITQESERMITKLQQTIASHRDWSRKGVLELRELLDRQGFYKAGNQLYQDSNRLVTSVRGKLNDIAATLKDGSIDEEFKLALDTASKDIDFLKKIGVNITGRAKDNVTLGASKVRSLVNAIQDPGTRQEALDLVQRLAAETGNDIYDEILSLAKSKSLMDDLPGLRHPIDTGMELLSRGAAGAARTLGTLRDKAGNIIEGGKDLIDDAVNSSKKN